MCLSKKPYAKNRYAKDKKRLKNKDKTKNKLQVYIAKKEKDQELNYYNDKITYKNNKNNFDKSIIKIL